MVTTLKGSTRLRSASQPFSPGVSGLTCGPLVKRLYQFMGGAQGGKLCFAFAASAVSAFPASTSAPFVGQGAADVFAFWLCIFGCGASGSCGCAAAVSV